MELVNVDNDVDVAYKDARINVVVVVVVLPDCYTGRKLDCDVVGVGMGE